MERQLIRPRNNWQARCEEAGFTFHSMEGVYWDESACWTFTEDEIEVLESATLELHRMCLAAVDTVIRKGRFAEMGIPEEWGPYVEQSWRLREPSLYGRFDLAFDGASPPKLLEYNADTPTALLETSVVQWMWLEDCFPGADQFNSVHEKLIDRWSEVRRLLPAMSKVHFSCAKDHEEDWVTISYLQDTACQAGLETGVIPVEEIGWSQDRKCFMDLEDSPIDYLFKLYPWEWMMREPFGVLLVQSTGDPALRMPFFFEPAWKSILSNKALLPILWELYPGHENLLRASFHEEDLRNTVRSYVRKPIFSREGANVSVRSAGVPWLETDGTYGQEGHIYQEYSPLPCVQGNHAVIGSWVIGDQPAGIGIREDSSTVTKNTSRFVPHLFQP